MGQRPAPAGLVQPDRADQFQIGFERQGFRPGAVGAAVVRDRDAGAEREAVVQVGVQPPDAAGQATLLVPDRDDQFDLDTDGRFRQFAWTRRPARGGHHANVGRHAVRSLGFL